MSLYSWSLFSSKADSVLIRKVVNMILALVGRLDQIILNSCLTLRIYNSEVSLSLATYFYTFPAVTPEKFFLNRDFIILLPGSTNSNSFLLTEKYYTRAKASRSLVISPHFFPYTLFPCSLLQTLISNKVDYFLRVKPTLSWPQYRPRSIPL